MKIGDICRVINKTGGTLPHNSVVKVVQLEGNGLVIVSNGFFTTRTTEQALQVTEPPNGQFCHDPLKCTQAGRCLKNPVCTE